MIAEDYIVAAGLLCGLVGIGMLVVGFRKAGWF